MIAQEPNETTKKRSDDKQTYILFFTNRRQKRSPEAVEDVGRYSKSDLAEMTTPAALLIKDSIAEVDNITLYDRDWSCLLLVRGAGGSKIFESLEFFTKWAECRCPHFDS